jgi:glycosyltransferase involved in cell wall biosynthesis
VTRRVAIVNSSSQIGGAELSLLPVVRLLRETADVIAFIPGDGPLHEELRALNVATQAFLLPGTLARASRQYGTRTGARLALAMPRQQAAMTAALRRARPDVVYCNGFRAQLGATLPARLLRIPVVWHVRDFVPNDAFGRLWRLLSRGTTTVIANSTATAHQPLLRASKVVVILNGVDLDRFRPRGAAPAGAAVVGMAGHLTPWKGHKRFARVVRRLRDDRPELRAEIAGGDLYDTAEHDRYAAELRRSIDDLGLQDALVVTHVPADEMPSFLARLTVLVHCPDRPEPFGRTLAEALATGVPVVAAAGPGAAEVVGEAGVVLPIGDEAEIVGAVRSLLADPERRASLSAAGVERARRLFDERAYAARAAEQIIGAIGRRQRRFASSS